MNTILTAKNLTLAYGEKVLVQNLNFHVVENDFLCVVGPNGVGKSTLIKALLGLLPVQGRQIESAVPKNQIGYLPQQVELVQHFPASVWEVVSLGCVGALGFLPFFTAKQRAKIEHAMHTMHIENIKNERFVNLSGGQKQRVLLARALCAGSKLLVLDEPVNGLDPQITQTLYQNIATFAKEGIAILMVTHDVQGAIAHGKNILHLGKTPFFGTAESYKHSAQAKHFLGDSECTL